MSAGEPPPASLFWPALLLAVGLSAAALHPVVHGYFYADDLFNLYRIANEGIVGFVLRPMAGHVLLTRNAIFVLCRQLFGAEPAGYFWLAFATHLLNAGLLFALIRALTRSVGLACLGAAAWGALPAAADTLAWYSVYGQVIATTALLWILLDLARLSGSDLPGRMRLRWALLALAAGTSFAIATAAAVALPWAAWLLPEPSPARRRALRFLLGCSAAVALAYLMAYQLASALYEISVPVGRLLHSTAPEFLGRTLWLAWGLLVHGTASLLLRAPGGLGGALGGPSRAVAAAFLAAALLTLWRGSPTGRRRLLGCLGLALACYTSVALGRGSYGNVEMLAVSERYQYLAAAFLAVSVCLVLGETRARLPLPRLATGGLAIAALGAGGWLQAQLAPPIDRHMFPRTVVRKTLTGIRQQIQRTPRGGSVYITNPDRPFPAVGPQLARRRAAFPGPAAVFAIHFPENVVLGRRVYFVESDPRVREAARAGRRTAELLVAPDEVPRAPQRAAPARVLLIGDSITFGVVSAPAGPSFAELLARELAGDALVITLGCGGTTAADWRPGAGPVTCRMGPVEKHARLFAERVRPRTPAALAVVLLGTNDAALEVAPFLYRRHMALLLRGLRAAGVEEVIVASPPPRPGAPAELAERLTHYRAATLGPARGLCRTLPGVRCGPDLLALLEPARDFAPANPHPNARGHARIAAALAESIRERPIE